MRPVQPAVRCAAAVLLLLLVVTAPALAQATPAALTAAGLDVDRDGVRDDQDRCPGTSGRTVTTGCTLRQALAQPRTLLAGVEEAAATAVPSLRGLRQVRTASRSAAASVAAAPGRLAAALDRLHVGDVCGAARGARSALVRLQASSARYGRAVRGGLRRVVADRRAAAGGDADDRDAAWAAIGLRRTQVSAVATRAGALAQRLRSLCAGRRERTITGRVREVDEVSQAVRLDPGGWVSLAGMREAPPVGAGMRVRATGSALAGVGLLAGELKAVDAAAHLPAVDLPCVRFEVQPYAIPEGSITHDLAGYRAGGQLHLEQVARFRTTMLGCPGRAADGRILRYSGRVELAYRRANGTAATTVLGTDLGAGGRSAKLPEDISEQPALLTFRTQRQACSDRFEGDLYILDCAAKETMRTEQEHLVVHGPGAFGQAFYDQNVFALGDRTTVSYGVSRMSGFQPRNEAVLEGTSRFVQGLGYSTDGSPSSKPPVSVIPFGQPFRVYNAFGELAPPDEAFTGPRAGLLGAQLAGERNGRPFVFSLERDWVTTDASTLCKGRDAFYRLPWTFGTVQEVTQGNATDFTHKGRWRYAFDFGHDTGTPIRAARGGKVIAVEESYTKTSDPRKVKAGEEEWQPANALHVLHMDGTVSAYFHMEKNGVVPEVGDFVHRGQLVASSGNTGNSTGPHLHFHVVTQLKNRTHPIRFDVAFDGVPVPCWSLKEGAEPTSTNS